MIYSHAPVLILNEKFHRIDEQNERAISANLSRCQSKRIPTNWTIRHCSYFFFLFIFAIWLFVPFNNFFRLQISCVLYLIEQMFCFVFSCVLQKNKIILILCLYIWKTKKKIGECVCMHKVRSINHGIHSVCGRFGCGSNKKNAVFNQR